MPSTQELKEAGALLSVSPRLPCVHLVVANSYLMSLLNSFLVCLLRCPASLLSQYFDLHSTGWLCWPPNGSPFSVFSFHPCNQRSYWGATLSAVFLSRNLEWFCITYRDKIQLLIDTPFRFLLESLLFKLTLFKPVFGDVLNWNCLHILNLVMVGDVSKLNRGFFIPSSAFPPSTFPSSLHCLLLLQISARC